MKKAWVMQNLQGRRWLGDQRLGQLTDVIEKNDHARLEELLSQSTKQQTQKLLLTRALERSVLFKSDTYVRCVRILLRYGANPSGCDGIGTPYVILAAESGCVRILRALVDAGCDVNMTKHDSSSALHKVATAGNIISAKMLMGSGSNLYAKDNLGRTPLLIACSLNKGDLVEEMLKYSNRTLNTEICNAPDNSGTFPLFYAISHDNSKVVSLLISEGAELNVAHTCLISPLMVAAHYGFVDCLAVLHNNGSILDKVNDAGETAILIAAKCGHLPVFEYLLQKCGADPSIPDKSYNTTILYTTDCPDITAELLSKGVLVNLEGENGHTPLSIAIDKCHTRSVLLLLQYGADPDPVFKLHRDMPKPLQSALWNGFVAITQLLFTICVELGYDMTWLEEFLAMSEMVNRLANGTEKEQMVIQWVTEEMSKVEHQFPRLVTLCRWNIRDHCGDISLCDKIESLPIPKSLRDFLNFRELDVFANDE